MNPIKNMDMWYNNLDKFRTIIKERYSIVLNSIQKEFNLTNSEYEKTLVLENETKRRNISLPFEATNTASIQSCLTNL